MFLGATAFSYAGSGCCSAGKEKTTVAKTACCSQEKATAKAGDSCCSGKTMADKANHSAAKLYVVKMHSDACGACKSMNDGYAKTKASLKGTPVSFFTFDLTSDETKAASWAKAEKLGIKDTIKANMGMARLLVINAETGELVNVIKGKQESEKYVQAIQSNLAPAS